MQDEPGRDAPGRDGSGRDSSAFGDKLDAGLRDIQKLVWTALGLVETAAL
jgi:hypothetical protein